MAGKVGYSYIRFSSKKQELGDSLKRQTEATEAWAKRNGVRLDRSLSAADLGVSGFKGLHHGDADRYGLAAFLEACRQGKVAPDSFLVVENLDRLSREHIRAATRLWMEILDHKVNIVTTSPEKVYRHDSQESTDIIFAIVELSRGHSESAIKSERIRKAWKSKHEAARLKKAPVSGACPKWLRLVDGGYQVIPEKAAVIRRVFQMASQGVGMSRICKRLNAEGVPPLGRAHAFNSGDLKRLLSSRTVLGEYQPGKGRIKEAVGEPVPDYYPRIITDGEWAMAQQSIASRRWKRGAKLADTTGLFTRLVRHPEGWTWTYIRSRVKGVLYEYLNPCIGRKRDAKHPSLPYRVFERVILGAIREIQAADLLPSDRVSAGVRLSEVVAQLAEADTKLKAIEERLYADPTNETWTRLLDRVMTERAGLVDEQKRLRAELQSPATDTLAEVQSLAEVAAERPDLRPKLASRLAVLLERVELRLTKDGGYIYAAARLRFRRADYSRCVLWRYEPRAKRVEYPVASFKVVLDLNDGLDVSDMLPTLEWQAAPYEATIQDDGPKTNTAERSVEDVPEPPRKRRRAGTCG